MSISRRRILKSTGGGLAGILATGVAPYHFVRNIAKAAEGDTIKVGILHSLSGTCAIIESALHNAELRAIEEINAKVPARKSNRSSKIRNQWCKSSLRGEEAPT
jgi:hypothetical protein